MTKLFNFEEKRKLSIEKKRRNFERMLFQNFLGAYTVIDQDGQIYPVTLVDISREGFLFEVPWNLKTDKKFEKDKELMMRMYFTKESYIPVIVNIRYGKEHIKQNGETYMHYGCEFDKSISSFEAMESFINFMYKFAELSVHDKGDRKVFFL